MQLEQQVRDLQHENEDLTGRLAEGTLDLRRTKSQNLLEFEDELV